MTEGFRSRPFYVFNVFLVKICLIFRETLLVLRVVIILLQSRSLWVSLVLILLSLVAIYRRVNLTSYQGVVLLLYGLVFIGGLMVLLVRISSLLSYENRFLISSFFYWVVLIIFCNSLFLKSESYFNIFLSVCFSEDFILVFILLLVAISNLSWQASSFKRISRNL